MWTLTTLGEEKGGTYKDSKQYGKYIVWPENIELDSSCSKIYLTASQIGKHFEISANKINYIFSELGWIEKGIKGWVSTKQGKKLGAYQSEDIRSGIPYVKWTESILDNKSLKETIQHIKGDTKSSESK